MNFKILTEPDADWYTVGKWFDSFISLAEKLHGAKLAGDEYKRILLAVPQSEMVSLALAIGFSRSAFLFESDKATPVNLDEIRVGDLIQIRSAWHQPQGFIRTPANVVGQVLEIDSSDGRIFNLKLMFDVTGEIQPRRLVKPIDAQAAKDPLKHVRLFRVPEGTPQRDGKPLREFAKPSGTIDDLRKWVTKWENWEYQVDPTFAIFGPKTKIADYGKIQFKDLELHSKLLHIEYDNLLNVARLDSLSNDLKPHFVNVIEQLSAFPTRDTPVANSLDKFPFVCLDGNAALASLSDKNLLDKKCVIGIWETGKPLLQEQAISSFVSHATLYTPVKDFENRLNWQAPAGVQCWGWN